MFLMNSLDDLVNNIGKYYRILPIILTILYGLIFIGVIYINPDYLYNFRIVMQLLVCLFLIYRFHPYRTHVLKEYDSKIIFSSAMFLLINLGAVEVVNKLITPIDNTMNVLDIPIDEIVNIVETM